MATKHYVCDYEIEKKGKTVHAGTIQFARVNAPEDEDEDDAFAAAQKDYANLKLKRETFKEAIAVDSIPKDEVGNLVKVEDSTTLFAARPPVIVMP